MPATVTLNLDKYLTTQKGMRRTVLFGIPAGYSYIRISPRTSTSHKQDEKGVPLFVVIRISHPSCPPLTDLSLKHIS
jgi:hypothetical protein